MAVKCVHAHLWRQDQTETQTASPTCLGIHTVTPGRLVTSGCTVPPKKTVSTEVKALSSLTSGRPLEGTGLMSAVRPHCSRSDLLNSFLPGQLGFACCKASLHCTDGCYQWQACIKCTMNSSHTCLRFRLSVS